jgi:sulfur carrier protein ThiS
MRMHRGSSKGSREPRVPETLPLSAPPAPPGGTDEIEIVIEVLRGGRTTVRSERVSAGTTVRVLLRRVGVAPEGCAVLLRDRSVPLDLPLDRPERLTVVPTFSGG